MANSYDGSSVSVSMKKSDLTREVIFALVLEGIAIAALVIGVLAHPVNPAELLIFLLLTFMVVVATRVPFTTTIVGDELVTKGVRGRKSISLSSVSGVKAVAGSRWDPCLKVKDSSNRIAFLALRSVSRDDRLKIQPPLEASLLSFVSADKRCAKVWAGWFSTQIRVTRTVVIKRPSDS